MKHDAIGKTILTSKLASYEREQKPKIRSRASTSRKTAMVLVAAVTVALATPIHAQPDRTRSEWRALAEADLAAAVSILANQTPIPFDGENPAYANWLETGRQAAIESVAEVGDQVGHFYLLARFANGFGDPHIRVEPASGLPPPSWPGFVAAPRGPSADVVYRDDGDAAAPELGARIVACDGLTLEDLANERVFPFLMNHRIASDRRQAITRLFLDRGNPWARRPEHCDVDANGQRRHIALAWRPLSADDETYWNAYRSAAMGDPTRWGIEEPAPGITWIGIRTFVAGGETGAALLALESNISSRAAHMRAGRAVIIDVRGNGGGSSEWAQRIATAIFGEANIHHARRRLTRRLAEDWRATPENIAYFEKWLQNVGAPELGEQSEAVRSIRQTVRGMRTAIAQGNPLWRNGPRRTEPSGGITTQRPRGHAPYPARVYLLTNGTCGSSCLDFADLVLHVPGVRLIGSATSGDGPYMEVRTVTLPSGLVRLTFPQKVVRGAARLPFEAYQPDIAYDGPWDDGSVRSWALNLARDTHN